MRHIHAETSLPPGHSTDPSLSRPSRETPLEPSSQCCTHRNILMGYNETEIKRQKVYQVSIFSHLSSSSESTEQRAGTRPAVKRGYPEQRTPEGGRDPKRTHWGDKSQDVSTSSSSSSSSFPSSSSSFSSSSSWPRHIACSTLHMRDSCPVSSGDQPIDYGENGEPASGHNVLHLELHGIAQTTPLDFGGKREKPGSSPAHTSRASGEAEGPAVTNGCREPPAPQTVLSPEPSNLSSQEMTPCGSSQLSSTCPAKRKLLPAGEVMADSCSEDESLSPPARKKRVLPCHPVPAACRSTDAKGAPFWNHLLPAAKVSIGHGRWQGMAWGCPELGTVLLGSESILKGRFAPSGRIEGFTAEIGASGSYCPQHVTLPVDVTYFDISEHSAPSPFLGVIDLEALGKKGYSVPKAGTIQVTLFNPNKTVVKMFLVTYDFQDMPANHMTFLRHRIFLVPVGEEEGSASEVNLLSSPRRFHSSKSGKIYLHDDIRLLFSRKSIEVDSGIPYELKSFTEMPRNPCYSLRA
uniref:Atos homolog protein B n=1 Tax=Malurus cyaneus samueli TaxID=2593467 RepID=A0A8C5X639_9PASS